MPLIRQIIIYVNLILLGWLLGFYSAFAAKIEIVEDELKPYYNQYQEIFKNECPSNKLKGYQNPNKKIVIISNIDESGIAGYCSIKLDAVTIVIDERYFKMSTDHEKRMVLFHELTHCLLNKTSHSEDPTNYMFYRLNPDIKPETLLEQVKTDIRNRCDD